MTRLVRASLTNSSPQRPQTWSTLQTAASTARSPSPSTSSPFAKSATCSPRRSLARTAQIDLQFEPSPACCEKPCCRKYDKLGTSELAPFATVRGSFAPLHGSRFACVSVLTSKGSTLEVTESLNTLHCVEPL